MGCGRPLADPPALFIVPFSVNFVLVSAHARRLAATGRPQRPFPPTAATPATTTPTTLD